MQLQIGMMNQKVKYKSQALETLQEKYDKIMEKD